MRELGLSWNFVSAWTQSEGQDFSQDSRGWKSGVMRTHPVDIKSRIIDIRKKLVEDADEYYTGDLAIQQTYSASYPSDPLPGIDYINDIIHDAGLVKTHRGKRRGTAVRYLCYPEACIKRQGVRIASVDFVGGKFITGHQYPLHFLSVAYKDPRRLRCIQRTNGETTEEAITITQETFDHLGWPDAVQTDAGNTFLGRSERRDGIGARSVSNYALFLLSNEVIPIFGAPRSPWNQGTVEGSNSVFGRNFWERHTFTSVEMVDERIAAFNASSKKYAQWKERWDRETTSVSFIPRICFIRKVGEDTREKKGVITIASESISFPKEYIGLFVFSEWHLKEQKLKVFFEREGAVLQIEEKSFPIHPKSQERCTQFIA